MASTLSERFVVSTPDDLDELEHAISEGGLPAVMVEIPESATALLSAREFRRVVGAARDVGTDLEFQTDDPLRRELARILGARLAEPETAPPSPQTTDTASEDALTRRIEPATTIEPPNDEEATFRLWQPGREAGKWTEPEETDASYSFVITPPRRSNVIVTGPATQSTDHWRIDLPRFEDWERIAPARRQPTRPSRRRRSRRIGVTLFAVTLLIIAGLLAAFVVPTATITVAPLVSPVSVDLTYGIAGPDAPWDVLIQPTTIENTLTFSSALPTSGERFEPDAAATGNLQLTNASTEDVVIPAGTQFLGASGHEVISTTDVVVPAADPYSSLMFGSATVDVRSAVSGPDGNVDRQIVFGQLDGGIFFVNREPLGGGTMKRISTVTQADHDALNERARNELTARSASALDGRVPPGQQIVPGSTQPGTVVVTFDHAVGSDAVTVKIEGSLRVSAQAYDPDAALDQAKTEAQRRIADAAGSSAQLITNSMEIAEPQPIEGANGTAFMIRIQGTAEALVDIESLRAIRSDLTGQNPAVAMARIQQIPGVAGVVIEPKRAWLTDNLPRFPSRITINVGTSMTSTESSTVHAEDLPTKTASTRATAARS